jgi:hypothetical protein
MGLKIDSEKALVGSDTGLKDKRARKLKKTPS